MIGEVTRKGEDQIASGEVDGDGKQGKSVPRGNVNPELSSGQMEVRSQIIKRH